MKNLQEWIDFKANCMMVLQHISAMSFGVGEDKITIKYNGLSGEYKSKNLPKEQKELLQESIYEAFQLQFNIKKLIKQYVLDELKREAKEYINIFGDLEEFAEKNL